MLIYGDKLDVIIVWFYVVYMGIYKLRENVEI